MSSPSTWSPFDCLPVAQLTPSGLLQKEPEEVELLTREGIELRSGMTDPMVCIDANGQAANTSNKKWVDRTENLTLTITTHRIVFWQSSSSARFLHLSNVLQADTETLLFRSPKILLNSYMGDFLLVYSKFAPKDRDDCLKHIQQSLQRQEWEAAQRRQAKARQTKSLTARKVGVDAILSASKVKHQQAAKLTDSAFEGDVETLRKEASELVGIIQKYVATLDKHNSENEAEANQLVDMLSDMGMTSALSKEDFRGREDSYYGQLARELADFLRPKLKKVGGIMTLTDVYCLYNRARGSNLLSPEDLLKAVERMSQLKLGMSIRDFPSGLRVIQDDTLDDRKMAQQLSEQAAANGLTELEASKICQISAVLAHEQLLAAEQMGYLCRDETLESLKFYPNRFAEWKPKQ